ncbi:unnamed protein product [Malus baccata var. baccata]
MGYKTQVVVSTIALPIHRKNEKGGQSTIGFHRVLWPRTATYRGYQEGGGGMKNTTGVGRNRRQKMGGRGDG